MSPSHAVGLELQKHRSQMDSGDASTIPHSGLRTGGRDPFDGRVKAPLVTIPRSGLGTKKAIHFRKPLP
jgi:hypothetical protein